jgi:hypothetical protein
MNSSKHKVYAVGLAVIIAWMAAAPMTSAKAKAPSKTIVLTGTVGSIFMVDTPAPLRHCWGIYFHVERVKKGRYSEPTFTFTVHSPAHSGLRVGERYTIEANWTGKEYEVSISGIRAEGSGR